jgi:hypothetical protein
LSSAFLPLAPVKGGTSSFILAERRIILEFLLKCMFLLVLFLRQEKYIEIIQNYYTDGLYLFAVNEDVNVRYMLGIIKTEGDKNYLTRKCERLDKEIDQLVYQLYGLTEACPPKVYRRRKEIKIVEEK